MNGNRSVIYTAIFGKKDTLHDPLFVPPGWDLVCFTDQSLSSRVWQVRRVEAPEKDPTRSARKYKILAHEWLSEYDVSVWIDGNILIKKDLRELVSRYLASANLAVLDHSALKEIPLSTLQAHEERLLWMESIGKHQDDAGLIRRQGEAYRHAGYPDTQGLACTLFMIRRHQKPDVITAMERWWEELSKWSKRDQMSFNYAAWKTGLRFNYIPLDAFGNEYMDRLNHQLPFRKKLHSYWLGGVKRFKKIFS
ncbi:DUF616 domain-containing protein [Candidatus Kaiserbacteria bacterium]|nr:DUF616 domain-containing protein [Candidatus Kaiserbacteria bacterium]